MEYFRIKNWTKHQHYKDRRPPWIKLHNSLFDDYEFQCLQDASKLQLIAIWLLASRSNHFSDKKEPLLPVDKNYLKRQSGLLGDYDLNVLFDSGFIIRYQDASNPLATCYTETETETYKQETQLSSTKVDGVPVPRPRKPRKRIVYTDEFNQFWSLYPRGVGKGEAFIEWQKVITDGYPAEKVTKAAGEYAEQVRREGREESKIRHACRFLKRDFWKDYCFKEVGV